MEEGTYYPHSGLPLSQGSPDLGGRQTGSFSSDVLPYAYYSQVNTEPYSTGLFSSLQSGPTQEMDGVWMPHYEPAPLPSTVPGHEGAPHAWIGNSASAEFAESDQIHNSGQFEHSVSTGASFDPSHLHTEANTGPYFSAPSTFPRIPSIPSASTVEHGEEGTSQSLPLQSPRATTTASPPSSGQPTGAREVPKQSYVCTDCGEEYAQIQGFKRHYRTKHHPSSCSLCGFKWGRPEHYRNHLTKRHGLDAAAVDKIMGKPAGSRRRTPIIGRDLPQNISPPAIINKHDRPTQTKPRRRQRMPPLSPEDEVAHVPSAFLSTEALAPPVNDVVDHVVTNASGQVHFYRPFVQPNHGDGTYSHTYPAPPPDGRQYGQHGRY